MFILINNNNIYFFQVMITFFFTNNNNNIFTSNNNDNSLKNIKKKSENLKQNVYAKIYKNSILSMEKIYGESHVKSRA